MNESAPAVTPCDASCDHEHAHTTPSISTEPIVTYGDSSSNFEALQYPQRTVTPLQSETDPLSDTEEYPYHETQLASFMVSLSLKEESSTSRTKNRNESGSSSSDIMASVTRPLRRTNNRCSSNLSSICTESATPSSSSSPHSPSRPYSQSCLEHNSAVRFNEVVTAVLIPDRSEYSREQKRVLFHTKKEISANVSRNLLEFAAEGYDWRNVTEEDDMIMDEDGQWVHPVHIIKSLASGRQAPPPTCEAALLETFSDDNTLDDEILSLQRSVPSTQTPKWTAPMHHSDTLTHLPKPVPQRPIHPSLLEHDTPKRPMKIKPSNREDEKISSWSSQSHHHRHRRHHGHRIKDQHATLDQSRQSSHALQQACAVASELDFVGQNRNHNYYHNF